MSTSEMKPKPYAWSFDRNPWDSRSDATTFSVGLYQWIPKASGEGLKKSNTIRVIGYVADAEAVYAKAAELRERLNREKIRFDAPPPWLKKQFSVPRVASVPKKPAVKDRLTQMARDVLEPGLKPLGFRRSGRKFWRDDGKTCQVICLTMNRWGDSRRSSVDVDLGVFWHEVAEVMRDPARHKMPPPEHRCTFRIRLEGTRHEGPCRTWEVRLDADMQKLGRDLLDEIKEHGLQWLAYRSEIRNALDITRYLRKDGERTYTSLETGLGWERPVFMVMLGKKEQAKKELLSYLSGGPTDAAALALAEGLRIDLSEAKSEWAKK
jgi:hypothetical protein